MQEGKVSYKEHSLHFTHIGGALVAFATRKDIAISSQFLEKSIQHVSWSCIIHVNNTNLKDDRARKESKLKKNKRKKKPVFGRIFSD